MVWPTSPPVMHGGSCIDALLFLQFVLLPSYATQSEVLWVGSFRRERILPAIGLRRLGSGNWSDRSPF